MNITITETPRGPLDATPPIMVEVDGSKFSDVTRSKGWLIAEIPDDVDGVKEVRGRNVRDLRIRAGIPA